MIEQTCHIKSTKILWIHHYFSTNFNQFINQTPVIITSKLKDHVKDLLTVALFYESEIFATPPPPPSVVTIYKQYAVIVKTVRV